MTAVLDGSFSARYGSGQTVRLDRCSDPGPYSNAAVKNSCIFFGLSSTMQELGEHTNPGSEVWILFVGKEREVSREKRGSEGR